MDPTSLLLNVPQEEEEDAEDEDNEEDGKHFDMIRIQHFHSSLPSSPPQTTYTKLITLELVREKSIFRRNSETDVES